MNKNQYMELKEKNIECWNLVEKAINDLIENNDLQEKTLKEYIVGYIVQCIINHYPSIREHQCY